MCRRYFPLLLLLLFAACREIPSDRLYALPLDHPPTAADWERALPRTVLAKGGRVHRINPLPDVDQDTVHTSTASCHHGAALPEPLEVDLRAFYSAGELWLRISWPDATRDDAFRRWHFDGEKWINEGGLEDGLGLIWDHRRQFPRFTCAYACHIRDFGVTGSTFRASNRMQLPREGERLDMWHWKAERTGRFGFADDRTLDHEGMHGDLPGELFRENSRFRQEEREPFGEGDAPVYDAEGLPVAKTFRPAGSTAPGYLTELPMGGRGDVSATADWRHGRWTVVLRRALATPDADDVRFVPGDREGIPFGLSILDHTLNEHYATMSEERLVLLGADEKRPSAALP